MAMAVDDQPAVTSRRFPALSAGSSRRVQVRGQEDDAEMTRVLKKHRTSSEAPVPGAQMFEEELRKNSAGAADLEAFANEEREADPEGDEWDNLDAEDADDRLMVSEYVVEIFKYMKEVEVFLHFLVMWHQLTLLPSNRPYPTLYMGSQTGLAWSMRGILTLNARDTLS